MNIAGPKPLGQELRNIYIYARQSIQWLRHCGSSSKGSLPQTLKKKIILFLFQLQRGITFGIIKQIAYSHIFHKTFLECEITSRLHKKHTILNSPFTEICLGTRSHHSLCYALSTSSGIKSTSKQQHENFSPNRLQGK